MLFLFADQFGDDQIQDLKDEEAAEAFADKFGWHLIGESSSVMDYDGNVHWLH